MGRPKGSKNKRQELKQPLINKALRHFDLAVDQGEQWAIQAVIERQFPKLKAITPHNSLDAKLIEARIFELTELEQRLLVLENKGA